MPASWRKILPKKSATRDGKLAGYAPLAEAGLKTPAHWRAWLALWKPKYDARGRRALPAEDRKRKKKR